MEGKKCKKCGEMIYSSTNVCFKCGKDQRNFIKKYFWIFIVLILIIALVFITRKDHREVNIIGAELQGNSQSSVTEKQSYNIGEMYENGYLDVTCIFALNDFRKYSQYAEIKSQHKVLQAEFEFRNVSTINRSITSNDFKCYADGKECERFYKVDESSFSLTLSAGKEITKYIYFQVPTKAKEVKIQYETFSAENGYVEFIVKE